VGFSSQNSRLFEVFLKQNSMMRLVTRAGLIGYSNSPINRSSSLARYLYATATEQSPTNNNVGFDSFLEGERES